MLFKRTNPWGRSRRRPFWLVVPLLILVVVGWLWQGVRIHSSAWAIISPGEILNIALPLLRFNSPSVQPTGTDNRSAIPGEPSQPSSWFENKNDYLNRILEGQIPLLGGRVDPTGGTLAAKTAPNRGNVSEVEGEDYPDVDIPREDPRGEGATEPDHSTASGEVMPTILIYHTHNGESYAASGGEARKEGQNGGVFNVGTRMTDRLEQWKDKYGIAVEHSSRIHDAPSYNLAYNESRKTVLEFLQKYPNPLALIDLHRDALPTRETVTISNKTAAKILLVIGTDQRAPHPHWKDNLRFAEKIQSKLDELYPGLCKGVVTKSGRYHQQMHPRAVLVEIGSDQNSTKEAETAGDMFAVALMEVLKEENLIK
ncbi:stage II sporulation protein P [Heliobacterium mobile]|uniref:stage II sporulation protein P n=1 Tax=Heliobacterium mobile TaxID=28064 RepID=UPI0014796CD5|nr:stage II sporulation protein P [Heliobacterium mobile]